MSDAAWTGLLGLVGEYAGQGVNHEGQPYLGRARITSRLGGKGLELVASATGLDGAVYHEERSTLARRPDGTIGLWVLSSNHPGLVEHRLDPDWPAAPGARTWSFRLGDPGDAGSFREVVCLDRWPDGALGHRYAWGLPGGAFAERSGARLERCQRLPVPEAPLAPGAEGGLAPVGPGWFVVNLDQARWSVSDRFGAWCPFEGPGPGRFEQVGVNVTVLAPGQPACHYHGEADQEDFLVLRGECLVVIEGQERRLRAWDFVHCPPWTRHVFVGAGAGPCAILMLGARVRQGLIYPLDPLAQRHGACPARETESPEESYAGTPPKREIPARWPL